MNSLGFTWHIKDNYNFIQRCLIHVATPFNAQAKGQAGKKIWIFVLKMVNSNELRMLPSSEFWLMTKILEDMTTKYCGVYTPISPLFQHPFSKQKISPTFIRSILSNENGIART